jgi:subtilisin family serine protease
VIQAPEAWQEEQATGFGIKIAVVDSGIDIGHEDFACPGKLLILPGSDVSGRTVDDEPQDKDGHGTHVNGIAGACADNGTGVAGVAPDATLVPVRAIGGNQDLDKAMADGITFATDAGAHVINLSIGDIPPFSHLGPDGYPLTEDALAYSRSQGVVIASAAGNFVQPTCEYPSLSRNVICVGATDRNDERSYYSDLPVNTDRNSENPGIEPSVMAPGGQGTFCDESVVSTYLRSEKSICYASGYEGLDGTSMSAPHVAGVAALVYDRLGGERSAANAQTIVDAIIDTADDLYTPGYDPISGYGRVNALKAVQSVEAVVPDPDVTTSPSPTTDPEPVATEVSFTEDSATSGQFSDEAAVEALLVANDGAPLAGEELKFTLFGDGGTEEFLATTNEEGIAARGILLDEQPGDYQLLVNYAGSEDEYLPSEDATVFAVNKEDVDATLTVSGSGKRRTLHASLVDADSVVSPIAGRVVDFYADGKLIGSATTDDNGTAELSVPPKYRGAKVSFEARFEGDDYYHPARADESS